MGVNTLGGDCCHKEMLSATIPIPTIEYAKKRYDEVMQKQKAKNDALCLENLEKAINAGNERIYMQPSDDVKKNLIESGYIVSESDKFNGVFVSWVEKAPNENSTWCVIL